MLPLYFTSGDERGGRNDFLGTVKKGKTLRSFNANPGGYIGFFDPSLNHDNTWFADELGRKRLAAKHQLKAGRGQRRRKAVAEMEKKG